MSQVLASQATCIHCGTIFFAVADVRFCCGGCEFVFNLIQAEGLSRYYELRDASPPVCPVPAQRSSSNYEFCDDPEFIAKLSPDGLRLRFYLEGMNCTACLWLLEKLPSFCADAVSIRVNMATSTVEVHRRPEGSFAKIAQTLNRFGYRPHPLRETEESEQLQIRERRQDLIRLGVAGAATGNIMILAVSLYGGAAGDLATQFRWLSAFLALPVLTYCAWPFYRSTWASILSRRLNLDVPIVTALLAGIVTSLWGLLGSAETVYFDSLSMLVFLLLSSRFVLRSIQSQQLRSTHLEDELLLATVERVDEAGNVDKISSLSLAQGDVIRIAADSVIPVDGSVETGEGTLDISVLTGESDPLSVSPGMRVEAGSRPLSGSWTLRVENPPAKTRLARILRDTEISARAKPQFIHFADRVSRWFISIVLLLAAVLIAAFSPTDLHEGISRALALVIVTCPCVFGIAIPLSMSLAIRKAARKGIIIKDADAIERLWKTKALFFDKTGTLTTGVMSVLKIEAENQEDLGIALALEREQTHPVARAIVRHLDKMKVREAQISEIHALASGGVQGVVNHVRYALKPLSGRSENTSQIIRSTYGLFRDETRIASFQLGDQPRLESLPLLRWAREKGLITRLLSGDKQHVVQSCASLLEFSPEDIHAETSPERKATLLRQFPSGSLMVGDGANDAAALASADVGVAVCGSLDVSLRAADVYLTRPNLTGISDLLTLAEGAKTAIRRNLLFSASFNVVSGVLACSGLMTPLWAAVLMPLSSLTVLMSAVLSGRKS